MAAGLACDLGSYSAPGKKLCTFCPAGKSCSGLNKDPVTVKDCNDGEYSLKGELGCRKCPAGYSCPDKKFLLKCAPGSFSVEGKLACTPCPAGKYCPSSREDSATNCEPGSYSPGGLEKCLSCPAGHHCKNTAKFELCKMGTYALVGQTSKDGAASECIPCPEGFYCPRLDHLPIPCPLGTYSQSQWVKCKLCPDKSKCPTPSITERCGSNEYSPPGKYQLSYVLLRFCSRSAFESQRSSDRRTFSSSNDCNCLLFCCRRSHMLPLYSGG